jgi:winged helix DNA-binding protein
MPAPLSLTRAQILAFRRRVGALDRRLPRGARSLRIAAWAGLQDSMPRAASLSIHARVAGTTPTTWDDPSLVQLWGPRYSAYVVAAKDLAIFSLGRLPDDAKGRKRAEDAADRVESVLGLDRKMGYGEVGAALGVNANSLRYGTTTGRLVIRWEGARQPTLWCVPPPTITPEEARLELARRYLHVLGPTTLGSFARWAGITPAGGAKAFDALDGSLTVVRTPIGAARMLTTDVDEIRIAPGPDAPARLLPSGDAYYLLQGDDRKLLVPGADRRELLWTTRVWPGALLVNGEIVGTWRRAHEKVSIATWRRLTKAERDAVIEEAQALPLPALPGPIAVTWER